ncbi:MAG TPA: Rid family detoxifying hydrolase [Fimbriimonadales bacterium]|nr:Rid family detoxifying hydrolase [Fimbriimonadales bacterium]
MGERHIINTSRAPAAIGPYSHAVEATGRFFFISGQIGLRPDGKLAGPTIEEQTRQVINNIRGILDAAGMTPANLVKTTIYLTNLEHFSVVNDIYAEMVGAEPPARSTVQVVRLPKDALIEIEAIAVAGV